MGCQELPGVTGKFGLGVQNEAGQRLIEFCQENALVIATTLFQQLMRRLYTWMSPDGQYQNQIVYILAAKDGEALYSEQKQDWELTMAQIMNSFLRDQCKGIEKTKEWKILEISSRKVEILREHFMQR